ncbi:MAG: hypothetical protein A2X86_06075 [Bdellovibrionales bacterium GWA2_49_15]|nr:MAG: hypothetical protein A2X86_06075 [Bdellovibrionales bacterium GWA2_49_15]
MEEIRANIHIDSTASNNFFEWTCINLQSVTWQGHFQDDFLEFWRALFENAEIPIIFKRLEILISHTKIGPLYTWFVWLRSKFLIFCFVYKDLTLLELSHLSKIPMATIVFDLRLFLIRIFSAKEDQITELLHFPHIASDKAHLRFCDFSQLGIQAEQIWAVLADDPMTSLEITLYPEWETIFKSIKTKTKKELDQDVRKNFSESFFVKYLIHLIILSIVGSLLIFLLQYLSKYNEMVLAEQFEVYEPQFTWLDKGLVYKDKSNLTGADSFKNTFDEIEQITSRDINDYPNPEEERFETESEVVLTSWDAIPKEIEESDAMDLKAREGGFRDISTGSKKIFRLMMKSVVPLETRDEISKLVAKYQVEKGDKHAMGTFIPGGVYFNLFVPKEYTKEFLAQVFDIGESVLYESKTSIPNPPGKIRVLIWIKNI